MVMPGFVYLRWRTVTEAIPWSPRHDSAWGPALRYARQEVVAFIVSTRRELRGSGGKMPPRTRNPGCKPLGIPMGASPNQTRRTIWVSTKG